MKVHGDYQANGYAYIEGLIAPELAHVFLQRMEADLAAAKLSYQSFQQQGSALMNKATVEIPGHMYPPMMSFLWGLTPMMSHLTGRDLLPTYDYFRIYQQGDICRLHADRPSCEHSLSLTLAYSDAKPWPLAIGSDKMEGPDYPRESFGEEAHASIPMQAGDAVLYRGVEHRHGRIAPNPNRWSAHLFLHWVDREGPYKSHAFDAERIAAMQTAAAPA